MEKPTLNPPLVRCSFTEMVDISKLVPHPLNPNKHPPSQIEYFIAILQFQGVRRPITVSKRSGFITKGHGQLLAFQHAGWEQAPIDYQDYDSEEQELADIVADNTLQKMSEMETGKLQEIIVKLDTGAMDLKILGIEEKKLEKIMTVVRDPPQLTGDDGSPLAGVDGEHQDLPAGAEGAINSDTHAISQVRMTQLFFTEETQREFLHICEFFMKKINTENITDTTLEVLRAAYRSHQENSGDETETDLSHEPSSEGSMG